MRTYKTVKKQVEDTVRCDICDSLCTDEQLGGEYATLDAMWGYKSKKDGSKYEIHLCELCFDKIISWMRAERKKVLGPFNYPHTKDPLKGEDYDYL